MSKYFSRLVRRLKSNGKNNNDKVSTTQLMDLPVECLENIIKFLPTKHLYNVADTNKQLQSIVETVYRMRYARRPMEVSLKIRQNTRKVSKLEKVFPTIYNKLKSKPVKPRKNFADDFFGIELKELKASLQQIRLFGHLMEDLVVSCDEDVKNSDELYHQISEYCGQSIVKVHFFNTIPQNGLNKPFSNLEELYFYKGTLDSDLTQFDRWFPKLSLLYLDEVELDDPKCIARHIESLKFLSLGINSIEYIKDAIRLNPQLQYYEVAL